MKEGVLGSHWLLFILYLLPFVCKVLRDSVAQKDMLPPAGKQAQTSQGPSNGPGAPVSGNHCSSPMP
jgi:hypothetical protein